MNMFLVLYLELQHGGQHDFSSLAPLWFLNVCSAISSSADSLEQPVQLSDCSNLDWTVNLSTPNTTTGASSTLLCALTRPA